MKTALPENAKVSKEAKECVQECVSEFVSFITSEASEKCAAEKRKTVNGEDILFAMTSLGFENYAEVLKIYLAKYREFLMNKQDKSDKRRRDDAVDIQDQDDLDQDQDNELDVKAEDELDLDIDAQDDLDPDAELDVDVSHTGSTPYGEPKDDIYEQYSGQYMNQF